MLPAAAQQRKCANLITKGGAWRQHRDMWIAERDGDTARLKGLEAEQERGMDQLAARWRAATEKLK
jgi:hypothetical protein